MLRVAFIWISCGVLACGTTEPAADGGASGEGGHVLGHAGAEVDSGEGGMASDGSSGAGGHGGSVQAGSSGAGVAEVTGGAAGGQSDTSCEMASVAECAGIDACKIVIGSELNVPNECVEMTAQLGCAAKGCEDAAITYARDPSDNVYRFSDGCIPGGWTETESPVEGDDVGWQPCD